MSLDSIFSGRCSHQVSRLPVIIHIQEGHSPEVAAALEIIYKEMKKRNLGGNGKAPLRVGETRHDEIETAIIQALAPLQNTAYFAELISKTSDYKQTLAHFAVDFGYTNLLRRLVEWKIDLTISDVNGFTALHCAYSKGDSACVELLLENGAPEIALDALGRAPYQLVSECFASLNDDDPDIPSDDQPELGQKLDAFQSTNSGHGVSHSDDEQSMNNAELLACDGVGGGIHEMSFRGVDRPEIDRYAGRPLQQSVVSPSPTWARALEAQIETLAKANARVVEAQEKVRTEAPALALTCERAQTPEPMEYTFAYNGVLADSKLKHSIYSINPDPPRTPAYNLWRSHTLQADWWCIQIIAPITRLPSDLLRHLLFISIDNASDPPLMLMLVCKQWHAIITAICVSLKLGTTTPERAVTSKLERHQQLLDVSVDTEFDRGHCIASEGAYEAIFAAIAASSQWRSFVVQTFPTQADLPEHFVDSGLQGCSNPVMSRLRTLKIKSACEMSPLLDRLLRIIGTTASEELRTVEINSPNVISFLVPTYSSIFRSVTVLSLDTPGLRDPVDLLPHLHQLESLTASHISLLISHSDVDLPFVQTLRHLSLRAVPIQWMSGRTFHVLERCTLLFPLHRRVLHTFRTTLPSCKHLTFQGYPLNILDGVSAHNLIHLSVLCSSSSSKQRGTQQLGWFSSQVLQESRLAPRILHISFEATTQAWVNALAFMSDLEELVIDNAKPYSLGAKVLQSLVVHPIHTNNPGTTATPGGRNTPVCPSLKRLGLRYRRWLRPSEHFDMNTEFMSIIRSRHQSMFPLESFRIWTRSDQKDPMELVEDSWISFEGFRLLADESGGDRDIQ